MLGLLVWTPLAFSQKTDRLTQAYGPALQDILKENNTPRTQAIKKTCDRVSHQVFPQNDYPSDAQLKQFQVYNSIQFYYGMDKPIDYVKARYSAFAELNQSDILPLNGIGMLMMLYANGLGVARNLDLATHLACLSDGSLMEMEGRIDHLQKMKTESHPTLFDFCDDATSGMLQGYCSEKENQIQESKQQKTLLNVVKTWPISDKNALATLKQVASHYFVDSSNHEIDLSGTAAVGFSSEHREKLQTQFYSHIMQFEKSQFPNHSKIDLEKSDQLLNANYQKILSRQNPNIVGTINLEGIRITQRSWIRYRNAFVKFANQRYPKLNPDVLKTLLTLERIEALSVFLPEQDKNK